MDDNEEDENLFANDFDNLPENALDELEQNAIQLTQHPGVGSLQQGTTLEYDGHEPTHTSHQAAIEVEEGPLLRPLGSFQSPQQHVASRMSNPRPSSFYEDAHIPTSAEERRTYLPQHPPGEMTQREQWRQQRYGALRRPPQPSAAVRQNFESRDRTAHTLGLRSVDLDVDDPMMGHSFHELGAPKNEDPKPEMQPALSIQIAELARQRDDLLRDLNAANSTLITQKGEIAIIRANQVKDAKDFDRQILALKGSFQEGRTKYRQDLEATNQQSEKIANENRFLQYEIKNESGKVKALQKSLKAKEARSGNNDPPETPKTPGKGRQLPIRDGFQEEDIIMISPSKSGRRSKGGTPTNVGKRKRKVPEAGPIPALTLHESLPAAAKGPDDTKLLESAGETKTTVVVRKDRRARKSLQFMQRMLNYRLAPNQDRILEVFSQFALPSDPKKSFSSTMLEASASLSGETLPSGFSKIIIFLWSEALKEKYYEPVPLLISVMQYILALEHSVINSEIIQKIVPVLQSTTDVNGAVRFENSPVSHQNFGQFKQTPKSELNNQVDGTEALDTLYSIACSCVHDAKLSEEFWRAVDSSFVLMMLNVAQPIADLSLTLNLLSTSIMPTTFGKLMANEAEQQKMEHYLLYRIAYLLWETPRVDEGVAQPTRHEIYKLRMEALNLLCQLGLSSPLPSNDQPDHGSLLLVTHSTLIGRLVRFIYDTVDALYTPIEPSSPTHSLLSDLINRATLLLYRLLQQHGRSINLHDKLSAVNGGVQKHRVVLTRLAFSEGVYFESGITDETVAMAHEMLEEAVTPEEADALLEVFPASATARNGGAEAVE